MLFSPNYINILTASHLVCVINPGIPGAAPPPGGGGLLDPSLGIGVPPRVGNLDPV